MKQHRVDTKKKVFVPKRIIRKLTGTAEGANPSILHTSCLAFCFSTPARKNSAHADILHVLSFVLAVIAHFFFLLFLQRI